MANVTFDRIKSGAAICLASFSFSLAAPAAQSQAISAKAPEEAITPKPNQAEPLTQPKNSLKINGKEVNLEQLGKLSHTGINLGLFSKTTLDRVNAGDSDPSTAKVEPFKNDQDRLSAIAALIEKSKITFKYQNKEVTATLSEVHAIFQYGMGKKYITPKDLNQVGLLNFEKVLEDNPGVKKNPKEIEELRKVVNQRNSAINQRLGSLMERFAEDLSVIKSLPGIPSWSALKALTHDS